MVPICFFACKSALAGMEPGAVLEISLKDPEAFRDLLTIIEHSRDRLLETREREDGYVLWVRRGDEVGSEGVET